MSTTQFPTIPITTHRPGDTLLENASAPVITSSSNSEPDPAGTGEATLVTSPPQALTEEVTIYTPGDTLTEVLAPLTGVSGETPIVLPPSTSAPLPPFENPLLLPLIPPITSFQGPLFQAVQYEPRAAARPMALVPPGPGVLSITPNIGNAVGGVPVAITGSGFVVGGTTVTIGGVAATSVVVTSPTTLTAVTPALPVSLIPVDVAVTTIYGTGTLAGGYTAFSPVDIAGMVAWYRADLGVSPPGGPVAAWADQSGNGHTLTQATPATQPTFNATDPAYGGQSSLSTNGSQFLRSASFTVAQPNTVFIVANTDGSATQQALFDGITATRHFVYNGGSPSLLAIYAGALLSDTGLTDGTPFVLCSQFSGVTSALFVNQETAGVVGDGGTNSLIGLTVATFEDNTGGLIGKVAEVIIYSGILSPSDRAAVTSYLGARYGIVIGP